MSVDNFVDKVLGKCLQALASMAIAGLMLN